MKTIGDERYREIMGTDSEESADLDQLCAARLAKQRGDQLSEDGWKKLDWTPKTRNSPLSIVMPCGHDLDHALAQGWHEQPYRLVNKDEGRTVFVAEPWKITKEGLENLNRIEGWRITICAERSLYSPGQTTAVWLERA